MVRPTAHRSPSTRALARLPRDAPAAAPRVRECNSTRWPRPSRREHANVLVGVFCAHNGTKHQQKHKSTPQGSTRPTPRTFPLAHTRRDPCNHGSPIVHTSRASHTPHGPNNAQSCSMSGIKLNQLPHAAAHTHERDKPRKQGERAPHARVRAARTATAHAAARQRQQLRSATLASVFLSRAANLPRG